MKVQVLSDILHSIICHRLFIADNSPYNLVESTTAQFVENNSTAELVNQTIETIKLYKNKNFWDDKLLIGKNNNKLIY